jgi:hypothetical protein
MTAATDDYLFQLFRKLHFSELAASTARVPARRG